MFYTIDFTRMQYRRRRVVSAGYVILALLGIGLICLVSLRLRRMAETPTLDQRLQACQADAQTLLTSLEDWGRSRQRFQEIAPFWQLETAHEAPSALLALVLTNRPAWRQWLAPRRFSFSDNSQAELEFDLWFQGTENKAGVLAAARASLTNGLAAWSPKVTFQEEVRLATHDRIWVRVNCAPPPHRWPGGMAAPPERLVTLASLISNQHADIWSSTPLKGYDKKTKLEGALDKALLEAKGYLGEEAKGKTHLARWKICRQQTLSPSEVFNQVRRDLQKQCVTDEPGELVRVESAWRHLAGRWWRSPRAIDPNRLGPIVNELKTILNMKMPAHQTFEGFGVWMDRYRNVFTNALTCEDIRVNGRDRSRLEEMYAEVLPQADKPSIGSVERALAYPDAVMGYSDWTLKPQGKGVDLDGLHRLAIRLDRAAPGFRLSSLEVWFDDKRPPAESWDAPPSASLFKGLVPWQLPSLGCQEGGVK